MYGLIAVKVWIYKGDILGKIGAKVNVVEKDKAEEVAKEIK